MSDLKDLYEKNVLDIFSSTFSKEYTKGSFDSRILPVAKGLPTLWCNDKVMDTEYDN